MSDTPIILCGESINIQADGSAKRFSGVAYSGAVMSVAPYGPLAIDVTGLEIPPTVPIRVDHGDGLTAIIGQGQCRIEAGRLLVSGIIAADTDAGKHLAALAKAGVKLELSVGARPLEKSYVAPREVIRCNGRALTADEGFMLVSKSKLYEISIVDRGADVGGTSLNIAAQSPPADKPAMTFAAWCAAIGVLPEDLTANPELEKRLRQKFNEAMGLAPSPDSSTPDDKEQKTMSTDVSAVSAERERFQKICARCDRAIEIIGADTASKIRSEAIMGGWSLDKTDATLLGCENAALKLQRFRAELPHGPVICANRHVAGGNPRQLVEAMILGRLGRDDLTEKFYGAEVAQRARDQRCGSLVEIIRAGFTLAGHDCPSDAGEMIRASGPSTIDVPTALGGSMDKIAMDSYRQAPATWRSFCANKPTANFREQTGIRINDLGIPSLLPPSGEIKHTNLTESTYAFRADTYALRGVFTRQSVINDDLGLLQDAAMSAGRGAVRKQSDVCYTVLLGNGGSFFDAGNNNYFDGAGTTLQSSQLAVALKMMRQQTSASGDVLDISPSVLLVPPELETTGRELLQSDFIQRLATYSGPTGNVWKGSLSLEVEPRLSASSFTGYSTSAWYLFASPVDAPMIATFLNGSEGPVVEFFGPDADPGSLSYSWRVYSDFGFALADPKAAVKSKGAA